MISLELVQIMIIFVFGPLDFQIDGPFSCRYRAHISWSVLMQLLKAPAQSEVLIRGPVHLVSRHVSVSIHFLLEQSYGLLCFTLGFLESRSDLTDSDNCPPSPLLGWPFLMSFVRVCACWCVFSTRDKTTQQDRHSTCQPVNYPLSGCVLVAGSYRSSADGRRPGGGGMDGCGEAGRALLLWRGKMGLWGPGWLPLFGTAALFLLLFLLSNSYSRGFSSLSLLQTWFFG